nr:hypothetical protein [Yoonia sp.]
MARADAQALAPGPGPIAPDLQSPAAFCTRFTLWRAGDFSSRIPPPALLDSAQHGAGVKTCPF